MRKRPMLCAAAAGIAYFGVVFAAGFVLGTLRVLVVTPRIGEFSAVLIELPVILALSWVACRWLIARFDVPAILSARMVMGGLALAIVMVAEIGVSTLVFGRTFGDHVGRYHELTALLGLAAQFAFAALPAVRLATDRLQ